MAKDKSKTKGKADAKPDKGKGKGKVATKSEFARPSDAPATGGDGWKFADPDNIGKLFLFTPLREDTTTVTRGKKTEEMTIIVADVVALHDKSPATKSVEHENVYIFPKWVQGALRGYIGEEMVLGRLEQDADKSQGDRPAWVLEDATDEDIEIARAYRAAANPLKMSGADKAKAKGGKAKGKSKGK